MPQRWPILCICCLGCLGHSWPLHSELSRQVFHTNGSEHRKTPHHILLSTPHSSANEQRRCSASKVAASLKCSPTIRHNRKSSSIQS
ncbi:unnamed protein product [Protopolystoma xenopodis]|uniref:Secreted protein n=1 Tax=Protopolystoma xenopodis TaxID=117903 RepID=A0A448X973_9PLAT|nr:unnamed protein product [Protopolystoma xenopodis]